MDEESRTLWCGNLSDKVTEEVLYELFLQAAPLEAVRIPTDRNGRRANYAFVIVKHEASVDYVVQLLDGTELYERSITIKPRNSNQNARNTFQQNPINDLLMLGQMLQPPGTTPFQQNFHNERAYGKPYQRPDNYSGRQNWNNNHRNSQNRRRYY